ncbi:hypothetical protein LWP59_06190 [Amycolatopsis acidiphila]|uniref:PE domain-containing protein n=1 Tax=Amycolatopsis acidiphila TaxID=715473 RepID=A0A557ZWG7_9PSEU|nr:hypothetical protein [Amycolatopsis acidiphila]TVT16340.1 hypothetical protein FNH06_34835 [Amycolatopsis acidiphila]UIJ61222.1 hypothetical protein LWP59_06190 [Amycolatopsis acidiphila]GHG97709.1 hypothetical protein GCM10017788_77340 [Amycolatopsis acidiphila]
MSDDDTTAQVRQQATAVTESRRLLSGVELKQMATTGGFAVDETTGDRMIQALQGIIDSLEARWSALQQFQQAPPLSTTATSKWVSDVMVRTAADDRGLLTQLQQAKAELPTYIEAIKLAKSNYQSQDGDTGTTLTRVGTEQA